ncbi:MAG: hypothetical protein KBT20_07875 [Bacteroidales bacterium]|nr:hypothetical protein [Candidatus Liminaster caballi]
MEFKSETKSALILMLTAGAILSACEKDASYDALTESDGIDLTVDIANGGLTIPFGSSDKIMLTELIDPEDSDIIETDENGNYKISKDGDIDPTSFNVDPVNVTSEPTVPTQKFEFSVPEENYDRTTFPELYDEIKRPDSKGLTLDVVIYNAIHRAIDKAVSDSIESTTQRIRTEMAGYPEDVINAAIETAIGIIDKDHITDSITNSVNIPTEFTSSCDDLSFEDNSDFSLKAENVDEGVKKLLQIDFDNATNGISVNLDVAGLPVSSTAYSISILDFSMSMPGYVELSNAEGGKDIVDPAKTNTVKLSNENLPVAIGGSTTSLDLGFCLKSLVFSEADPLVNVNGTLERPGETIHIEGIAKTTPMTISTSSIMVKNAGDGNYLALKDSVIIEPLISKINTTVSNVIGYFDPAIDDINTNIDIDLGEDLDFLKEDDAKLDLKDPNFNIHIKNACTIPLYASITLNGSNGKTVTFDNVLLSPDEGKTEVDLTLCATINDPANHVYANKELSTMLQPVPETIDAKIVVKTDSQNPYAFNLGEEIEVSGSYAVDAPLEFNNIHIKYDELAEDVFGEDDDISDYLTEIKDAVLSFTCESTVELDLNLIISANDKNGKEDPSLVTFTPATIKAGKTNAAVKSDVKSTISIKDISAVKDLIIRIEGNGSDCILKSSQYIKLSDAKLKLNKLQIDLNEKD